jgi:Outer membrane receptor proteins, mostly Fe transport
MRNSLTAIAWILALGGFSVQGYAQTSSGDSSSGTANGTHESTEGEIIVTARKRGESIQDVPIAIAAVTGDTLHEKNLITFDELPSLTAGFTVTRTGNNVPVLRIRGLGTGAGNDSFEQSVAAFLDGTYVGRSSEFNQPIFDLERVEIIKGTQASLLAKNTSLGAISMVTRKPGDRFAGNIGASYEFELGSYTMDAGVDIPLGNSLAVRLSGQVGRQGGWVTNRILGNENDVKRWAGRAIAVWKPAEGLDATLLYQQYESKALDQPIEYVADVLGRARSLALASGYTGFETDLDGRNFATDSFGAQTDKTSGRRGIATVNYGPGDYTLTSVSSYSSFDQRRKFDAEFLPGPYLTANPNNLGNEQFTQEVRLSSPASRAFNFVVGAFYLHERFDYDRLLVSNIVPLTGSMEEHFSLKTNTISGFGQANYEISPRFTASLGLRVTNERREASFDRVTLTPGLLTTLVYPAIAPATRKKAATNLDGSLGVQYQLSPGKLLYASFSRGTKGGGFLNAPTSAATAAYGRERADTFEAGTKLSFGRSFLNISLFQTDLSDFQTALFNGTAFIISAVDARSRGVELEGGLQVDDHFRISGSMTYNHARDENDELLVNAPKWSGNVNASYDRDISTDLRLKAEAGVEFRSRVLYTSEAQTLGFGTDPTVALSPSGNPYGRINARIALGDPDGRWELALIGRNLADKKIVAYGLPAPFVTGAAVGALDLPRTVAIQLTGRF